MSKHISKENLENFQLTNYLGIRDQIKMPYLAFMSGNYIISDLIQKCTHSPGSHVGVLFYLKEIDRVMILESVEDVGVRFIPLSGYVNNYKGEVIIAHINNLPDLDYNLKFAKYIDRCLIKYDKKEFVRIVKRIIAGKGKAHENELDICSEFVHRVFENVYDFEYDKRGFISPENIYTNKEVELLGRVK